MQTRLYLFQILGIIALVCGYFLSDQPDRLSVMHFDPTSPNVIKKAIKATDKDAALLESFSKQSSSPSKTNEPKYIPLELMMPGKTGYSIRRCTPVTHNCTVHPHYDYLFFKEINPPPPKC